MLSRLALGASTLHPAPFDLAGPTLGVEVTRGDRKLPIAEVPNLAGGDRVGTGEARLQGRDAAQISTPPGSTADSKAQEPTAQSKNAETAAKSASGYAH
jgi:hypothetical protein